MRVVAGVEGAEMMTERVGAMGSCTRLCTSIPPQGSEGTVRPCQVANSESLPSMFAIRTRFRATAVRVAQSWFLAFPM